MRVVINRINTDKRAGFTVLELMVATSVFGVVLLVLTAGVLSFSKDYFAGIRRSNTQTVARTVMDDISRNARFAHSMSSGSNGNTKSYCFDNSVMYMYAVGREVAESNDTATHKNKYGLIKRTGSCVATPPDITSSSFVPALDDQELLATNMRISNLSITPSANIFTIKVRIAYGDDDLFGATATTPNSFWATMGCKARFATQFCAVSDLSSTIQKRFLL